MKSATRRLLAAGVATALVCPPIPAWADTMRQMQRGEGGLEELADQIRGGQTGVDVASAGAEEAVARAAEQYFRRLTRRYLAFDDPDLPGNEIRLTKRPTQPPEEGLKSSAARWVQAMVASLRARKDSVTESSIRELLAPHAGRYNQPADPTQLPHMAAAIRAATRTAGMEEEEYPIDPQVARLLVVLFHEQPDKVSSPLTILQQGLSRFHDLQWQQFLHALIWVPDRERVAALLKQVFLESTDQALDIRRRLLTTIYQDRLGETLLAVILVLGDGYLSKAELEEILGQVEVELPMFELGDSTWRTGIANAFLIAVIEREILDEHDKAGFEHPSLHNLIAHSYALLAERYRLVSFLPEFTMFAQQKEQLAGLFHLNAALLGGAAPDAIRQAEEAVTAAYWTHQVEYAYLVEAEDQRPIERLWHLRHLLVWEQAYEEYAGYHQGMDAGYREQVVKLEQALSELLARERHRLRFPGLANGSANAIRQHNLALFNDPEFLSVAVLHGDQYRHPQGRPGVWVIPVVVERETGRTQRWTLGTVVPAGWMQVNLWATRALRLAIAPESRKLPLPQAFTDSVWIFDHATDAGLAGLEEDGWGFLRSDERLALKASNPGQALQLLLPRALGPSALRADIAVSEIGELNTPGVQDALLTVIRERPTDQGFAQAVYRLYLRATQEGLTPAVAEALEQLPKNQWPEGAREFYREIQVWSADGPPRQFVRDWVDAGEAEGGRIEESLDGWALAPEIHARVVEAIVAFRRDPQMTAVQLRDHLRPLMDAAAAVGFVGHALKPLRGDLLPGTRFRLGGPYDAASIQTLRQWPEYQDRVRAMQPGWLSEVGFLGSGEDLVNVLLQDYPTLQQLGVSPAQLADRLAQALKSREPGIVEVNGQRIQVEVLRTKGFQESPLPMVPTSSRLYTLTNLDTGLRLSGTATEMHPALIRFYGFFEGHVVAPPGSGYGDLGVTTFRLDPRELYALFTGQPLAELPGGNADAEELSATALAEQVHGLIDQIKPPLDLIALYTGKLQANAEDRDALEQLQRSWVAIDKLMSPYKTLHNAMGVIVGHEFNNALTGVLGAIELVRALGARPTDLDLLEQATTEAQRRFAEWRRMDGEALQVLARRAEIANLGSASQTPGGLEEVTVDQAREVGRVLTEAFDGPEGPLARIDQSLAALRDAGSLEDAAIQEQMGAVVEAAWPLAIQDRVAPGTTIMEISQFLFNTLNHEWNNAANKFGFAQLQASRPNHQRLPGHWREMRRALLRLRAILMELRETTAVEQGIAPADRPVMVLGASDTVPQTPRLEASLWTRWETLAAEADRAAASAGHVVTVLGPQAMAEQGPLVKLLLDDAHPQGRALLTDRVICWVDETTSPDQIQQLRAHGIGIVTDPAALPALLGQSPYAGAAVTLYVTGAERDRLPAALPSGVEVAVDRLLDFGLLLETVYANLTGTAELSTEQKSRLAWLAVVTDRYYQ